MHKSLSLFFACILTNSLMICAAPSTAVVPDSPALSAAIQVEDAFAAVVELAKPSVVVITNKQVVATGRPHAFIDPFQFFDLPDGWSWGYGDQLPQSTPRGQGQRGPQNRTVPAGMGSGIIIDTEGYLVTNCHVIQNSKFLEVKLSDGTIYDNEKDPEAVKIIGIDQETDLAVLKIGGDKKDFPALKFADSDKIRVGQWAIAIGAPYNFDYSVTIGCVSQKGRYDTGMSTFESYIQTDASINPGNSGGPLLNIRGEIIGINQFIYTGGSQGSIGLGFSIDSNLASQVVSALIENGEVSRPFLGIVMQELTPELKQNLGVQSGVLIADVTPGLGADAAGIVPGDIIQKVGDKQVNSAHEVLLAITKFRPGDMIPLTIVRDGKSEIINVKASDRNQGINLKAGTTGKPRKQPRNQSQPQEDILETLGLALREINGKVVVSGLADNGLAASVDQNGNCLSPGDTILRINNKKVNSVEEVVAALETSTKDSALIYAERQVKNHDTAMPKKFFITIPLK